MRSNEKLFALSKKNTAWYSCLLAKDGQKITPNGHFLFQNGTKYKIINNYTMLSIQPISHVLHCPSAVFDVDKLHTGNPFWYRQRYDKISSATSIRRAFTKPPPQNQSASIDLPIFEWSVFIKKRTGIFNWRNPSVANAYCTLKNNLSVSKGSSRPIRFRGHHGAAPALLESPDERSLFRWWNTTHLCL